MFCLEFDGWKQRHWTLPFVGERYSLVYFTPQGCEECVANETAVGNATAESASAIASRSNKKQRVVY